MISSLRGILAKSCHTWLRRSNLVAVFVPQEQDGSQTNTIITQQWICWRSSLHGPPAAPGLVTGASDNLEEAEMWELPWCGTISEQWSQAGLMSSSSTAFLVCTTQSSMFSVGFVHEKTKKTKTSSTALLKFSELLWQPDWPTGDQLTMATSPGAGTASPRSLHWWHFTSQDTSS